jgi:ElaB/YqjD/DUF883 family membrane-anchored ribosome-binding protein
VSEIVKAPPRAIVPAATPAEARAQLAAARERLARQLDDVQRALTPMSRWKDVVKRHPLVTIGGAFLVGYALSKLFSRK